MRKMQIKMTLDFTSYQSEYLRLKSQVKEDAGEDVYKDTAPFLLGLQAEKNTLKPIWNFLRKLKIVAHEEPVKPLLGI